MQTRKPLFFIVLLALLALRQALVQHGHFTPEAERLVYVLRELV
jgi:uncharacterized heparinase superfamily protein